MQTNSLDLSNIPTHGLIKAANLPLAQTLAYARATWKINRELDSRQPHFEPEYDSEGRIITSELMGYSEGVEIWS